MDFIIGKKYKEVISQNEEWELKLITLKGTHIFENKEGDYWTCDAEELEHHFTPFMQYLPCSLEDAQVGDTVERWNGDKEKVIDLVSEDGYYVRGENTYWTIDGFYYRGKTDTEDNIRFLHKAPKGIEPLKLGEKTTMDALKINELVSAVNSLTDRVKKMEGKQ